MTERLAGEQMGTANARVDAQFADGVALMEKALNADLLDLLDVRPCGARRRA